MRNFLKILVLIITIAAIGCLWYFTHKEHVERPLKRVELTVVRPNEKGFIDKDVEYQKIMRICDTMHNNLATMIPIDSVRQYIATIPWATYTDAHMTFDEILKVKIIETRWWTISSAAAACSTTASRSFRRRRLAATSTCRTSTAR